MEGCHLALAVLLDDFGLNDEWDPIISGGSTSFQPEHGETPWKTGNTTKDGLKSLCEVMGDEVLEDLDGGDP